jgi:hypothetical protein
MCQYLLYRKFTNKEILSSSNVFENHLSVKMDKDYFRKLINVKLNVGSARDHNKSTVPYSEHERELIGRLIRGELPNDTARDDNDDLLEASDEKSICPNPREGATVDDNSESNGDEELTNDEHATKAALALKKLGNMSRKKLDLNGLTAIDAHESQRFNELRGTVVSCQIFIHSHRV